MEADQYAYLRLGIDDHYTGGFYTHEDAVLAGNTCTPKDKTFLVGKCVPFTVEDFVPDRPLELIMEQMNQDSTETCGDLCDSWPNDVNIPEQNIKAVNESIKALITMLFAFNQPPCFKVVEVVEYKQSEES